MKKKEIDSVLAIVNTTYQLLVILCIKNTFYEGRIMDLVLSDKTKGLRELSQNPKLISMFRHIYYAESSKIHNLNKGGIQNFFESFVWNGTTEKIIGEPLSRYGECFYASPIGVDEITKELSKTLIRKNPSIRFKRYEDGVGSYTQLQGLVVSSPMGRFLYKKVLGFDNFEQEKEIYLFDPSLEMNQTEYEKIKIPIDDNGILKTAEDIFSVKNISVQQKCIFFGQGTSEYVEDVTRYKSIVDLVGEVIGDNEIIIKKHPRGVWDDFDGKFEFLDVEYPWELLGGREEMRDKILISYSSTACITGKLIYGTNNPVIFLYRLVGESLHNDSRIEPYFQRLEKKLDNIYIPNTVEELIWILKKLTDQLS